jgi:hypothetical protein
MADPAADFAPEPFVLMPHGLHLTDFPIAVGVNKAGETLWAPGLACFYKTYAGTVTIAMVADAWRDFFRTGAQVMAAHDQTHKRLAVANAADMAAMVDPAGPVRRPHGTG